MRLAPVLFALILGTLAMPVGAEEQKQQDGQAEPKPLHAAHIVIKGSYPEGAQAPGLFGDLVEGLSDGIGRLEKAADDESISVVILRLKSPAIGWAKLHELRRAVKHVRSKGKKVYAWLDSGASMDYLLAAACDEIIMPESGSLMLVGLRAEVSFYKNLLDMLDIKADMLRVGQYKSAAEPYTRSEMSPEFRKELEAVLDDYYRQMVEAIAEGRKLDSQKVAQLIDSGPYTARGAKEAGLIDRVAYEDQIETVIKGDRQDAEVRIARRYGKKKVDTDFSGMMGMVKMMNLLMGIEPGSTSSRGPKVAVIHATGPIMTGRSMQDLFGGNILGADTIVAAVRKADKDESVKAIVLRVDSPGGSALASDLIWRALEKVQKPFVVSMGDVAASGGYYISMGADYIYAEPGTLTGSIGVVGGKLAFNGLFEKAGITTTVIRRGKNSSILSSLHGFTESERRAMQKLLNEVYDQFTRKAAKGRRMELAELEKLARGRVYTGAMAVKIGLVDKLGTLDDAVDHAARLAGLDPDEGEIRRLVLPKPASPFEALFGPIDDPDAALKQLQARSLLGALGEISPEMLGHLRALGAVNRLAQESRLTLMPFRLIVR